MAPGGALDHDGNGCGKRHSPARWEHRPDTDVVDHFERPDPALVDQPPDAGVCLQGAGHSGNPQVRGVEAKGSALGTTKGERVTLDHFEALVAEPDRQAVASVCHNRQGTTGPGRRRCNTRVAGEGPDLATSRVPGCRECRDTTSPATRSPFCRRFESRRASASPVAPAGRSDKRRESARAASSSLARTMSYAYDAQAVESLWQARWSTEHAYEVDNDDVRPPSYLLCMYPYPSGPAHQGHVRNYTFGDLNVRWRTMQGYAVLSPFGFDSFGLPAENAAIKSGIHPRIFTDARIAELSSSVVRLGAVYDWRRTVRSHDPVVYEVQPGHFPEIPGGGAGLPEEGTGQLVPGVQYGPGQ